MGMARNTEAATERTESTARPLGEQNAVQSQAPAERTVGVGAHFRDADMRNVSE